MNLAQIIADAMAQLTDSDLLTSELFSTDVIVLGEDGTRVGIVDRVEIKDGALLIQCTAE